MADNAAAPAYVRTAAGNVYTRGDLAFVRNRAGEIKTVSAQDAERALEDPEYFPATAEDVAKRDIEIARSTLSERAKTVAENASQAAVDLPLAPVRLGLRAAKAAGANIETDPDRLTGRAFTEGVVHDFTAPRDENEAASADEAYRTGAAQRADVNAPYATAGSVLGTAPYALAGPAALAGEASAGLGLAGRLALQGAGGAAEGALYGESAATDDAYIENKPLTAEKLFASMGWGALIGGGSTLGLSALGEGISAARGAAGRGAREAVTDETAAALGGAKREARTAAAVDPTDARLADAADAAGVNPAARRAAAQGEAAKIVAEARTEAQALAPDGSNWRPFTKTATPKAQYLARDQVLDAASRETADDLTRVMERNQRIVDDLDNLEIKEGKIAANMAADGVDETAVIGGTQEQAAAARARGAEALTEVRARHAELFPAEPAAPLAPGAKPPRAAKVKVSGPEKALRSIDNIVRDHQGRIASAESASVAAREYDSMRRALSKKWRDVRNAARAARSYEDQELYRIVEPFAQNEYQTAADLLMDDAFVGPTQARAQRTINNARPGAIASEKHDLAPFITRVRDDADRAFGHATHVANPDAIRGMFEKLGPRGGGMRADQFARFNQNQETLLAAIRDGYVTNPKIEADILANLADVQKLRGSVGDATGAANAVNSAKAELELDQFGGGFVKQLAGSTILGGLQGGIPGAAKGFARGVLGGSKGALEFQERLGAVAGATHATPNEAKLAAWLESKVGQFTGTAGKGAATVNRTAGTVDEKVTGALDGYFDRIKAAAGQAERGVKKAIPLGRAAAAPVALKIFAGDETPERAYPRRVEQLMAMDRNMGAGIRDNTLAAMGGLAETAPRTAQHLAVTASRGVSYLLANTPTPTRAPSALNPSYRPTPSALELSQFAKRYAAVADPMTVLDDFQKGMVSYEQVDALKNVYPLLYQSIRVEALERFAKLDAAGIPVPYADRLQADLMLDLHGAGEPTLDPGFALKVSGMMQASAEQVSKPSPRDKPVDVAKSMASGSQMIGATLRGAT